MYHRQKQPGWKTRSVEVTVFCLCGHTSPWEPVLPVPVEILHTSETDRLHLCLSPLSQCTLCSLSLRTGSCLSFSRRIWFYLESDVFETIIRVREKAQDLDQAQKACVLPIFVTMSLPKILASPTVQMWALAWIMAHILWLRLLVVHSYTVPSDPQGVCHSLQALSDLCGLKSLFMLLFSLDLFLF